MPVMVSGDAMTSLLQLPADGEASATFPETVDVAQVRNHFIENQTFMGNLQLFLAAVGAATGGV